MGELKEMTNRNIEKEISYDYYLDMKCGDDCETISYTSLIHILTELMDRVEKLEEGLNKEQEYQ